ncbi:MAG: hypothetical protein KDD73_15490 [Anaerolineales bacterium]|nr:hypothetical protein [Anaerolineales bacterium]
MSLTNQDLLADAVRAIPAWKQFLEEKRAEQQALLAKMREQEADTVPLVTMGEGVTVGEGEIALATPPDADNPLNWLDDVADGTDTSAAPEDTDAANSGAGKPSIAPPPVAGRTLAERFAPLAGGAATPAEGATGPTEATVSPVSPVAPLGVTPTPLPTREKLTVSSTPSSTSEEGAESVARFPTSHLVETPEGDVVEEFHRALADAPPTTLPQVVQEAMEREDQRGVAEAFVAAQHEGALPPALDEAVTRLREVDFRFAEAHSRQADEDESVDYGF